MRVDSNGIGGQGELDVKRCHDDTRHMIIYDTLLPSPMGRRARDCGCFSPKMNMLPQNTPKKSAISKS